MALFFVGYYVVMAVTGVEAVSRENSIGGMKVLSGAALVDMVKTTWKMPLRQLGRLQGRIAPLARMLTAVVLMTGAAATIFTARRSPGLRLAGARHGGAGAASALRHELDLPVLQRRCA